MIEEFVKATLSEDVGRGDLYALISKSRPTSAKVIAKSDGVLSGEIYIDVLSELEKFQIKWLKHDGENFEKGDTLLEANGDSHTILKIERTLLNILHHSSSIATLTRKYVDLIEPYGVKLLDTRKTRPLLRVFEKYSTRVGGAVNHRLGLDDCLMLKDTHLKTIDNLQEYIKNARKKIPFTSKIEIEAETYAQAKEAMRVRADIVMCDNMSHGELRKVVKYRDENHATILLEASGNITLETIASYAECGVDAISSGSLIHQANWIDLSMKID